MAKSPAKTSAKTSAKPPAKAPKKASAPKAKASSSISIDKVCEDALAKLRELDVHVPLQADIEWCLGSYRADGNPVGLYAMAEKALIVLQEEKARKTKGVTTKLIGDLEKAIAQRS